MDTSLILSKIQKLADNLAADDSTFTRCDVAFELKEELHEVGIEGDSLEISRLVWECYQKTKDEAVAKRFLTNNRSYTLVEEYTIPALIEAGDIDSVFGTINLLAKNSKGIFNRLEDMLTKEVNPELVDHASSLINTVTGVEAIMRVQYDVQQIFAKYSSMTGAYIDARNTIRVLVSCFLELRQSTCDIYRKNALALIDIFGDSITATMPELFNFDSVQFLDVDAMKQSVKLAYDSIYGKCGALIGNVSDSFSNALSKSVSQFSIQKDGSVGLILAGINMISHYVRTGQQATALHRDFADLRSAISNDIAAIRADEVRLLEIYKLLNDVMIPEAEVFARNCEKVFTKELTALVDTIYSTPEARALKAQRDGIVSEMHTLEQRINDAKVSINYYNDHILTNQETLGSLKNYYIKAQETKPEPPTGIGNFFSLGAAQRVYVRELYDWNKNCSPVVDQYEGLALEIRVDSDEIERRQKAIKDDSLRYTELKLRQVDITKRIASMVDSTPETKRQMIAHLEDIVKLLHLAKKITEGKLDGRLLEATSVKRLEDIEIPENITNAVKNLRDSITKDMKFTEENARALTNNKVPKDIISQITTQGDSVLQDGIALCNEVVQLKAMKVVQNLSQEMYDREFAKIKEAFAEHMKNIDDRAAFIQETARKINTADGQESLKKALIELAGDYSTGFSPQDWDEFLEGKKNIQI